MDIRMLVIDRSTGVAISQQIVDGFLDLIETGYLTAGNKLPTERELAEHIGVARGTVKSAYKKLEQLGLIQTRQGSGSFVTRGEELSRKIQHKRAETIIAQTLSSLREMGLGTEDIRQLVDGALTQSAKRTINLAIIYDNPELLLDFKRQLSYLPGVSLSIFILESITEDHSPESLLASFDLIVTPTNHYQKIVGALPRIQDKIIEAAISPANDTLIELTAIPRNSRVGIICRTNAFLMLVRDILISFGFKEENIQSFFEMDYTTETYFPGGIDALISFGDAHIFTDPAFAFRNEEFTSKGGKIMAFHYTLDRGTVIYIEDKVRTLLG